MIKKDKIYFFFFRFRKIILDVLKILILGDTVGKIPGNTIRNIHEILHKKEFKKKIKVLRKLDYAHVQKYEFNDSYPYRFPREKSFDTKYIYKIKKALVASHSGVIILPEQKKILLQSVGSLNRLLDWGRVLEDLVIEPLNGFKVDNNVIVCPDTGYFHWLLEVMPNFIHLNQHIKENLQILISPNSSKYVHEALNYLLGDKAKSLIIEASNKVFAENVYFTSFEDESGYVRISDINVIKSAFKKFIKPSSPLNKIYISRLKTSKRKIGNELEVEKTVKQHGYQIIYAEELNFEEQIKIFSSSSHIIGPHGAGLSNIVWCNSGTRLIEIFPHNNLHFCYATLALTMNLNYEYLECGEDKNSFGLVNLNELENKLK